jgi:hypothetical protein
VTQVQDAREAIEICVHDRVKVQHPNGEWEKTASWCAFVGITQVNSAPFRNLAVHIVKSKSIGPKTPHILYLAMKTLRCIKVGMIAFTVNFYYYSFHKKITIQ